MTVPRRVLVSRQARELLAQQLGALDEASAPVQFLVLEDLVGETSPALDAAFISRDITGLSTKHTLLQPLAGCYALLRLSPQLAWVHTHSAGADRPIYAELMARGVTVTTSSGSNAAVVAQSALAGLLALARQFPALMAAQQQRHWAPLVAGAWPPDLAGQTAVMLGWGPIAQTLQPLLSLLGLQVVVVRRSAQAAAPGVPTVPFTALQTVLPNADWLLLCCPLNAQTLGLVDADVLRQLPRGAQLINVARGEILVEADLIAALQSGHLAGAYLDVFEHEPLAAASALWALPNLILTPHSAGHSAGNAARVVALFANNLPRWLSGQPLAHVVR